MKALQLNEALNILLDHVQEIEETERADLWKARGRVLAEDVFASHSQPPFDRSPLDGYAVQSGDIREASKEKPAELKVIDEVCAGYTTGKEVVSGTAVRIMTGAPIPKGADCIVGQEDTDYGEETVHIYRSEKHYGNYCFAGEDYKKGTLLLKKNLLINPVEIGLMANLGRTDAVVYRKPRVAVISTGDEIVWPGEALAPGKIYDSNLYTMAAMAESYGAEVIHREIAPDRAGLVARRIGDLAAQADLIVTSGGVSVGKKDIMHDVLKILEVEPLFWRVAIKPGMPTLTAEYRGKLLICLSGNPYGAAVNTELLVRPVIGKLGRRKDLAIRRKKAVIRNSYPKRSPVTRYIRAFYEGNEVWMANGSNDSGVLSTMSGCNCFVEVPAGTLSVNAGDEVSIVIM